MIQVNQERTPFLNLLVNNLSPSARVQVGQILAARVLEILEGNQAVIMLDGEKILAETQIPLIKGQEIFLEVAGRLQGQIKLKVIPGPVQGDLPAVPEQVVRSLAQAGLPADEFHLNLVKELLEHNLPATPANLRQVLDVLQNLGSREPVLMQEVIKLLVGEIPVTPQGAIISLLGQDHGSTLLPSVYQMLKELKKGFAQVIRYGLELPPKPASAGPAGQTLDYGRLEDLLLKPDSGREQVLNQLTRLLERKPHPALAVLREAAVQQGDSISPAFKAALHQFEAALNLMERSREQDEPQGLRSSGQGDLYYLPLPLQNHGQIRVGDLFVWHRKDGKKRSPDEGLNLTFILSTENLGTLRIDVNARGKRLNIHFLADSEKNSGIIQDGLKGLASALHGLGFETGTIQCKAKPRTIKVPGEARKIPLSGLDIRV